MNYFIKNKLLLFIIFLGSLFLIAGLINKKESTNNVTTNNSVDKFVNEKSSPTTYDNKFKNELIKNLPKAKTLDNNGYHIFQSFNNCGPASLSMDLSYYGFQVSQEELGDRIRPYQVTGGDNDDKSVTFEELAKEAGNYNLNAYTRPLGNIELLKLFINNGMPVITRTWTKQNEDIGHYRIVKGYDDNMGVVIQDDSLQGKNLEYKYSDFNDLWEKFNYEYLVLVPNNKIEIAKTIMGTNQNYETAWKNTVILAEEKSKSNPDDIYNKFNLSVAYYNIGDYSKSVHVFEEVENQLPVRTLWYQTEPIMSYYKLKNYDKVFAITDRILNNQNRAFTELYIIRGKSYLDQNKIMLAKAEFENAVLYNKNNQESKKLLKSLDN